MVKVSLQRYKNIKYQVHPINKVFVSLFIFFWGMGVKTKQKNKEFVLNIFFKIGYICFLYLTSRCTILFVHLLMLNRIFVAMSENYFR